MATKIVNNLPEFNTIPFKNIPWGHFFLDGDGDLCIRMGESYAPSNAFYLEGDMLVDMSADTGVIPVNVTINIDSYGT